MASHLRFSSERPTDRPIVICAFSGWNDAAEAATGAIQHLERVWATTPLAHIDPDDFYDFTQVRPRVRRGDGLVREVVWPTVRLRYGHTPSGLAIALLSGPEPHLRWGQFCAAVRQMTIALDSPLLITLGSLGAEIAHTRDVPVYGASQNPQVIEALRVQPSEYEGPIGIIGAIHDECTAAHVPSASLWAAVPKYVPSVSSPKAALALVRRIGGILNEEISAHALVTATAEYESQLDQLVAENDDTARYVARLEADADRAAADRASKSGEQLVLEVERFLREN